MKCLENWINFSLGNATIFPDDPLCKQSRAEKPETSTRVPN